MQLRIKQRIFSWTDSYDVYDETGEARYEVAAEFFTFGHQIHVYDKRSGRELGSIHEKLFSFLPTFEIVIDGRTVGIIRKEFSFFTPRYQVDYRGWNVEGDLMGWEFDKEPEALADITAKILKDSTVLRFAERFMELKDSERELVMNLMDALKKED